MKHLSRIFFILGILLLGFAIYLWQKDYVVQYLHAKDEQKSIITEETEDTPPKIDFNKLGKNCVGWISIHNTVINYPVYQGKNNEQYLRHTSNGSYSMAGEIFLDASNTSPGLVDYNSVIYGHHLKNGTCFKQVADMVNQEMFNSVSTCWYVTREHSYKLKPLFVNIVKADSNDVRIFNFANDDEFNAYLKKMGSTAVAKSRSFVTGGIKLRKILSLVTCYYNNKTKDRAVAVFYLDKVL